MQKNPFSRFVSLSLSLLFAPAVIPGLAPSIARAQGAAPAAPAATPAARELTLDDALAMAKKANRTLAVGRTRVLQAQAQLDQAWSSLFPTIALQGKYTRNNAQASFATPTLGRLTIQPINQLDGVASFTAPLLNPALFPGVEAVKVGVETSQANYAASEDTVLFQVAQTYYTCAISEEVLVARRSNIEVARATLENARARFSAGAVTKVDVDRAENALVRAQQNEREALYAREQSYRTLGTLIQDPGPFHVQSSSVVTSVSPTPPPAQPLDVTLKLRPEFRALELSARSFEVQSRVYAWRWAPALSAFGNARVFNYDNFVGESHAWAVGVQLDWVIFDGGSRNAQKRLAAAQSAESQAQAEVLADNIRDDIANSRSQLATKDQGRVAAERQVELSRETIDLVRTQYEAGTATQLDLLQAQDNLVASELTLAQAHFDVAVADLTLRRAVGTFPPR